ncbi:DUF6275 family protein [Salinicoccus roseus]|uniref:DUF6275 family protein n=1 Tax=Salinicoccus roseus TaxID=45670 RepID=A0A0C2HEK1_9STAP|nr:DUF6275 family protein [Salinicoccus roseus]KIH70064.1 hypothetical protein SN16_11220 [Salinicoccus roseus]MDB0581374.1 DUF6275 family protein [Salinicoccus roseus]
MNHEEFMKKAKQLVVDYTNEKVERWGNTEVLARDIFVVWSVKALGNSKVLLGAPFDDGGMYYEVTLNGDKDEIYFDAYKKQENICIEI